jgi:hypothetical protein
MFSRRRHISLTGPIAGTSSNGAAQKSNLLSDGLRRLTGFEDDVTPSWKRPIVREMRL